MSKKTIDKHLISITPVCQYNILENRLYLNNQAVKLSANQGKLLQTLIDHKNNSVSHEQITFSIWDHQEVSPSSLRTLVYSLRTLLPNIPLETVSKNGYILRLKSR